MTTPEQPVNPGSFADYEAHVLAEAGTETPTYAERSDAYGRLVAQYRAELELVGEAQAELIGS